MDSFTTEIGAEFYLKPGDFLAMVTVTGGEIRGAVERPEERAPSLYFGGVGYLVRDRSQLTGAVASSALIGAQKC